jgi:hypothetical protein
MIDSSEAPDGFLRRRTVKAPTRALYDRVSSVFFQQYHICDRSDPKLIDENLDAAILALFLSGESKQESNQLFYAVRWACCLTNADLRLSARGRLGHSRLERQTPQPPETWGATVLQCRAFLDKFPAPHPRAVEVAKACVGFLLSFDLYGRGRDIIYAQKKELRKPLGRAAGSSAHHWALTFFPSTGGQ